MSPYLPTEQKINGCNNSLASNMRQYMRNQEGPNMFPYEYRNVSIADTMVVVIPPGFIYRLNSAIFTIGRGYPAGPYNIPNADVHQIGDT